MGIEGLGSWNEEVLTEASEVRFGWGVSGFCVRVEVGYEGGGRVHLKSTRLATHGSPKLVLDRSED